MTNSLNSVTRLPAISLVLLLFFTSVCAPFARDGQKRAADTLLPVFKIDRLKLKDAMKEWRKAAEKNSKVKDKNRKEYSYQISQFTALGAPAEPSFTLDLKNVTAEQALNEMVNQVNTTGAWSMSVVWDQVPVENITRIGAPTVDVQVSLIPAKK